MWLSRCGRGTKVPAERILRGGFQHVAKAARVCPWGQTLGDGGSGGMRSRGMSTSQPGGSAPSGTFEKFDDNGGSVQCLKLRNGCKIPQLGLSTYLIPPGLDTRKAVTHALNVGYRHVDTAELFRNEKDVGQAVRESGLPREQIFVTTKLWHAGSQSPLNACKQSLGRMGLDYVDAYFLHANKNVSLLKMWEGMQAVCDAGLARHIGISMASTAELSSIVEAGLSAPQIAQDALSPFSQQTSWVKQCAELGIHCSALSPLTGGVNLYNTKISTVAQRHGKSPSQVLIRWAIEKGYSCLPKSQDPSRIEENFNVFDFSLSDEDIALLDSIHSNSI